MNPILIDVPLQIETDRLILRAPLQAGDGNVVNQAIKDSIKAMVVFIPGNSYCWRNRNYPEKCPYRFFEKRKLSLSYLS